MERNLVTGFFESAERFPSRPALVVGRERFSYVALSRAVLAIAATIELAEQDPNPLIAVYAHRSKTAYAGILASLATGKGYVPLNPKFPIDRTRRMLASSGCSILIAGEECFAQLPKLLSETNHSLTVIMPDLGETPSWSSDFPRHPFISARGMQDGDDFSVQREIAPSAVAYLLFTSGSTGEPKGVAIHHSNVQSYLRYICNRYAVSEEDRFSQEFELTFDLSVHDMFVCWERGACLYCVPEKSVMMPAKFIRENGLTMWFSVPSVIGVMDKMRLLSPDTFPSLRCSLFCGEPLSVRYAQLWQKAAPHSLLENLYGPTEATIAITHFRLDHNGPQQQHLNGIVPIGWPFEGQQCRVIDPEGNGVQVGEGGELCLAGPQVTDGYWNDMQKTNKQFVELIGQGSARWYRTGDLVKQDAHGCLYFLGRIDQQVKVRGFRIELQEVESVLRRVCGTEQVVVVGWPLMEGLAEGLVAFVAGVQTLNEASVTQSCREFLPDYMVPKRYYLRDRFPLNSNGKIDRHALVRELENDVQKQNY